MVVNFKNISFDTNPYNIVSYFEELSILSFKTRSGLFSEQLQVHLHFHGTEDARQAYELITNGATNRKDILDIDIEVKSWPEETIEMVQEKHLASPPVKLHFL